MQRRNFITLLGGAAAWPFVARAQQRERMRRIGVLMTAAANDSNTLARLTAFAQELQQLGWSIGRNVQIDYRWGASDPNEARKHAIELAALAPDVVLASGSQAMAALQLATRTVPIVFFAVIDPLPAGGCLCWTSKAAKPAGATSGARRSFFPVVFQAGGGLSAISVRSAIRIALQAQDTV
jgi:putative ABC transport system substrate-binding protein